MEISEDKWLDYIIKLNDRKINRTRASGLTLWSLFGAFSFVLYRILDNLNMFSSMDNCFSILLWIAIAINIITTILNTVIIPLSSYFDADRRLSNKLEKKREFHVIIPILLIFALMSYVNIYIWFISKLFSLFVVEWPYFFMGIYFLLQVVGYALVRGYTIYLIRRSKINLDKDNIPERRNILSTYSNNSTRTLTFILGIFQTIACAYMLLNFNLDYYINHVIVIKFSLEIVIILVIVICMFFYYISTINEDWLVSLERRILTEGLSSDRTPV